jgi:hypothetical protein
MRLAGLEIPTVAVAELVEMLRDEYYFKAADTLERALASEQDMCRSRFGNAPQFSTCSMTPAGSF